MSNTLARSLEKMNKNEEAGAHRPNRAFPVDFILQFSASLQQFSVFFIETLLLWFYLVCRQLKVLPRKQSRGRGLGSPLTRHTLTSQSTWVPHKLSPDPFHAKIPSLDYLLCRYQCQRTFQVNALASLVYILPLNNLLCTYLFRLLFHSKSNFFSIKQTVQILSKSMSFISCDLNLDFIINLFVVLTISMSSTQI